MESSRKFIIATSRLKFGFILIVFQTVFHRVAQNILQLCLLSQPPKSWNYRHTLEFKALLVMDILCTHTASELIIALEMQYQAKVSAWVSPSAKFWEYGTIHSKYPLVQKFLETEWLLL